jgi:hypothetical protein
MSNPRTLWPVGLSALVAGGLVVMTALLSGSGVPPLVVRLAELALAAGAAYLVDDAAVAVTTTMPPGVWRRRAPLLIRGAGVLASTWLGILVILRWQESGLPVLGLTEEVIVLCAVAVAASAVIAWRGEPEPGGQVGPGLVLLGLAAVMMEPVLRVTIFVPDGGMGAIGRQVSWLGIGVCAAAVAVVASRDPAGR